MKTPVFLVAPLVLTAALAGCTSGQAQVDVTTTNVASFPAPPAEVQALAGGQVMTSDAAISIDVKQELDDLGKLGALTGEVSKNEVAGPDLDLLQHIVVTIASHDGQMPEEVLSESDVPRNHTAMQLPLLLTTGKIIEYLSEGKVDMHFYLTGQIPTRTLTLTHTLVAHVDVAMKGAVKL
ncbi:MAG: hypothetical protein JOZ69_08365 [Myxococcales bacterium]|nr:hypothetical protein [Myxococcales bacterium]